MKKVFASIFFLLFICMNTFAQKSKVNSAAVYYKEPYKKYGEALEAIEAAVTNEQTSTWAKTWYHRGMIHMLLYESEEYKNLCNKCLTTSYESFLKAIELDPKNEWVDEIKNIRIPYLTYHMFNEGITKFQEKKFVEALDAFEMVQKMTPEDTSSILNAAYSAEQAGLKEKAYFYYQKLVDMKYFDDEVFLSYTNLLRSDKKNDKALEVVKEGRKLFPDSLSLMLSEINILLSTDRTEEASKALDAAIEKDPNNPNLYLALGSTYDNMANPRDAAGNEIEKPTNSKELMVKAEAAYKKGLQISPTNYELNYNLGALYFNQGAEMANATNSIKDNAEYEREKKKYEDKFREAKPHLEMALENNPRGSAEDNNLYEGTVISLKEVYVRIGEMAKYEKIKNLLEK